MEKFSLQAFAFIQGVILARLLMPSDYGLLAMVAIFSGIARIMVDSGFASALIRKQDKTEIDYSTVFDANLIISIVVAFVLFLCSGTIASFYNQPILQEIIWVMCIQIVLNAAITIQGVRLTSELQFKKISIINVISTVVSGLFAIGMAVYGYGVWSLVFPGFLTIIVKAVLFWHFQHWIPGIGFSWKICKELFGFGSKIAASYLLGTIYENIYSIVIGKVFTAKDLGYYTRGLNYSQMPATTITGVLGGVAYPILSEIQQDTERLRNAYIKMIRLAAYVVFPIMLGLAAVAKPLLLLMLTDKWADAIIYLQVSCFALMWYPLHSLNLNLLQVKGRSDLFFKLEIYKKVLGVIIIAATIPFGILAMCWGSVLSSVLCLVINTYYTGKIIDVGFLKQMLFVAPAFMYSLTMGVLVWTTTLFIPSLTIQLIVGCVVGVVYYWSISKITKSEDYNYFCIVLKKNVIERFRKNG